LAQVTPQPVIPGYTTVSIAKGGTGATTAAGAITNLINGNTLAPSALTLPTGDLQSQLVSKRDRQALVCSGAQGRITATLATPIGTNPFELVENFKVSASAPTSPQGLFCISTSNIRVGSSFDAYIETDYVLWVRLFAAGGYPDYRLARLSLAAWVGQTIQLRIQRSSSGLAISINNAAQTYTDTAVGSAPAWTAAINGTMFDTGCNGTENPYTGPISCPLLVLGNLSSAEYLTFFTTSQLPQWMTPATPAGPAAVTGAWAKDSGTGTFTSTAVDNVAWNFSGSGQFHAATTIPVRTGDKVVIQSSVAGYLGTGSVYLYISGIASNYGDISTGYTVLTATATGNATLYFQASGASSATITGASIFTLGATHIDSADQPGNGLIWNSAAGSPTVLPTSGVTWAQPSNFDNRVSGSTSTNGNQQLLGATTLAANTAIRRIYARSVSGTPSITLGTTSGGNDLVTSTALSTTWKALTVAAPIISANSSVWVGSTSTDTVQLTIATTPLTP
jgi:hypothetical protein